MIGYVYEIVSKDKSITKTYIGSTWDMNERKRTHKKNCYNEKNRKYNTPVYRYIRENGGWDNWNMIVIESGDCMDRTELECAEQFYIDMSGGIKNLLNSYDAIIIPEQRKEKDIIYYTKCIQKNIDTKRFYCESCNKAYRSNRDLQRHYKSNKHINTK